MRGLNLAEGDGGGGTEEEDRTGADKREKREG